MMLTQTQLQDLKKAHEDWVDFLSLHGLKTYFNLYGELVSGEIRLAVKNGEVEFYYDWRKDKYSAIFLPSKPPVPATWRGMKPHATNHNVVKARNLPELIEKIKGIKAMVFCEEFWNNFDYTNADQIRLESGVMRCPKSKAFTISPILYGENFLAHDDPRRVESFH